MSNTSVPLGTVVHGSPPFGMDMPPLHGSILLVEDESFVREVTAEILVTAGYNVLTARSAVEAIREFRKHKGEVALLLVDIVLPGKNGRDMAKELMKEEPKLKTVFISGYPESANDQNSTHNTIYLSKPFSLGLLMQKIREVIAAS